MRARTIDRWFRIALISSALVSGSVHGGTPIDPDSLPLPGAAQSDEPTEFQSGLQSALDTASAEHYVPLSPSTTLGIETVVNFAKGNVALVNYLNDPTAANLQTMSVAFVESGLALTGSSLAYAVIVYFGIAATGPGVVAVGIAIGVASHLAAVGIVSMGDHK
jgi:hypothetical protein